MEQFSVSFTLGKGSELHGGNVSHNNREFLAGNVNDARSPLNICFAKTDIEEAYHLLFDKALAEYNARQKRPCRRIEDYYDHIDSGNREAPFYEVVVQFGDSIKAPVGSERGELAKQMLIEYMEDFQKRNPNLHVFNAMLHMDEASPHLHIDFVPFYTKGRVNGLRKGVSMKQALDEMGFRAKGRNENRLVEWERAEKKVMDQILESHGCIREDKHVTHKHMSVDEYKVMVNRKKLEQVLQARLGLSGTQRKTQQELLADLAASQQRVARLEKERRSPYTSFYFSSADKQAFVQEEMKKAGIHFRETDNGFEAPECHAKKIREIERTYKAPSSTIRERLRDDIDTCLYRSGDFEEFIRKLQEAGLEVKHGKYISVKPPYGQRFIRLKSLGVYYDEFSLKKRLKAKGRFEKRLDDAISDAKKQQKPTVPVLQEVRHYIVAVETGTLPIRRKNHGLPYSWINDSELDKLLRLNAMLNEGMTADTIRQKAEALEAEAKKKSDELEQAEHHLRDYLIMKEKIEMVFEGKKSDVFTIEQARSAVRKYPNITAENYRNIDKVVEPAKEKVRQLAEEHQRLRDELREVTDALSVIERASNHTFVDHLVESQKRIEASEVLMNGIYPGETR